MAIMAERARSRRRRPSGRFAGRSCSPCRCSRCRRCRCRLAGGNGRWGRTTGRIGWANRSRRGRSRHPRGSRCRTRSSSAWCSPRIRGSRKARRRDNPCRSCIRRRNIQVLAKVRGLGTDRSCDLGNPNPVRTHLRRRCRTCRQHSGRRRQVGLEHGALGNYLPPDDVVQEPAHRRPAHCRRRPSGGRRERCGTRNLRWSTPTRPAPGQSRA